METRERMIGEWSARAASAAVSVKYCCHIIR